jgi:succinate---hydroxymethylglutarate CoA-transferase
MGSSIYKGIYILKKNKESAYYLCTNRNKKSITIDIQKKEGQEIIHKLASNCDVFVENFKVDNLKKLLF